MGTTEKNRNGLGSRLRGFLAQRNSLIFVLTVAIFTLLLYCSVLFFSTSSKVIERQSLSLAINGLVATLDTTYKAVKTGLDSSLDDSELLVLMGQGDSEAITTGSYQPFIISDGNSSIVDDSNLPEFLASRIETNYEQGEFSCFKLISTGKPARVCQVQIDGNYWLAASVEMSGTGKTFGLTRNVTAIVSRARNIERALAGMLALAYTIFLALLVLVLKIITKPLKILTSAIVNTAGGDFSQKVNIPTSFRELCALTDAFNRMGSKLKKQNESIEAYSQKLAQANIKAGAAVEQLSQRNIEQKTMIESAHEANRLTSPNEVIRLLLERFTDYLDLDSIAYYLPSPDGEFKPVHFPELRTPEAGTLTREILDSISTCHEAREIRQLRITSSDSPAETEIEFPSEPARLSRERLFIPLTAGPGNVGVVELVAKPGNGFEPDMIRFCRHLVSHIEVILINKVLYHETVRRSHELERINQISRSISGELDMDPLIRDVVENTKNTIRAECAYVGLVEGSRLQIHHITPGAAVVDQWVLEVDQDEHLVELVKRGRSILENDLEKDPRVCPGGIIQRNQFLSFVGCPIIRKDEVFGVICGYSHKAGAFTTSDLNFLELLAAQVAIAMDNARLFEGILARDRRRDHQLSMAQKLQANRIPKYFKQNVAAVSCRLQAADELAGDFCDVFSLGRYSIALVIGDVANKGVAASLMTFSLLSMFRNVAKTLKPPCDILESINRSLISQVKEDGWFATALYGRLNTKTGILTYSSAGHEQPIWYHAADGDAEILQTSGYPLGLFKSFPYETREIELKQGDRIILYTDGVTDASNADGERFGHDALLELVADSGDLSSEELTQEIIDHVESFTRGRKQKDDIVVAVLELQDDPWIHKTVSFAESSDLIAEILEALAPYELDMQAVYSIRLAIDEALANAWRHGLYENSDAEFSVSYHISDEGFSFRVKDPGKGFDHEDLPDPTVEENLFKTHGRGVFLIRQMMDDVEFNDSGNEIMVFKSFNPVDENPEFSCDQLLIDQIAELTRQQDSLEQARTAGNGHDNPEPASDQIEDPGIILTPDEDA